MDQNPETNPGNAYEFIMSEQPKKPRLNIGGGSFKQRLLIVGGGAVVLIVILVLIFGVFLGGGKDKIASAMYQVSATQQDIIGLTKLGIENLTNQQLINSSVTINTIVTSHLAETTDYIADTSYAKGSSDKIKTLLDDDYEASLEEAEVNGTYERTYETLLANSLTIYRSNLQTAYQVTGSNKLKTLLDGEYTQINELNFSD